MHTRFFRMRTDKSRNKGFSFIELLVSFVITFALIMGSAQLAMHSMMVKKRSDHRLNTISIILSQLDELKSHFFSGGEWQEGTFSEIVKASNGHQSYLLKWNVRSSPTGMKSVELVCSPENLPQMETRLLLYLSEELGF